MPSELQQVAADLLASIQRIPDMNGYLLRMAARCRDQAGYLVRFGSSHPAARTAALQLEAAARACEQAAEDAGRVPNIALGWVQKMVSGERPAAPSAAGGGGSSSGNVSRPSDRQNASNIDHSEPSDNIVAAIMRRLPQRGKGGPTTGLFIDENGTAEEFVSGRGELQKNALDLCKERGWPVYDRITHTEIKFAMHMRDRGLKNARLYINNIPCSAKLYNCVTLLPQFLPPGAKLVIYGPDGYKRAFEGESDGASE
ncbi:DddA-like double-stranded DNA deaminase toxin [Kribbella solani]|uniref:DddA-like double-stranded DNA deaminase toxin n=1 Tax=Kribbella solani TaxID=236067 RepID=UPI0029B49F91|nr:DddA-like double-stranded DNA deaminase toxin [Kribbella solani]MDX2974435.1 SCP1.201-like deaminase [Kribbella solani]